MKNIIILVISILSVIFSENNNFQMENCNEDIYKIIKIDSINNWYMIYATKQDSIYKIISFKEDCNLDSRIQVGKEYCFTLHMRRKNPPQIGNLKILPINYNDIKCFSYDNETIICIEDSVVDLCHTENLKGLCYISNP